MLPADISQNLAFGGGRVRQHGQRLGRVAGEDRLIEMLLPRCQLERDALLATDNVLHRRIEAKAQAIATLSQQGAHVFARAAGHHVPLRTLADIEQAVVFKKAQKQRQREAAHLLQR